MNLRPILLVEDNDDDAELTAMAFREANITNPVVRVATGELALDFLFGRGPYQGSEAPPAPIVVLLDLKLPGQSGLEVLERIRSDRRTRLLPVVVLTSSNEETDRTAAYGGLVNSYVRKPVEYDRFVAAARQLGLYWTVVNQPPPRGEP